MSDQKMIPYTAELVPNIKLLQDAGEAHLRIAGKDVFVSRDQISAEMLDKAREGEQIVITLPEPFVLANGLPLPASETGANIHGIGPDTPAGPNPDYKPPIADVVSSTSDARTVNNVMRHDYRVLSDAEKEQMKAVKDLGADFVGKLSDIDPAGSRELSIAKTKMEEAVMWAVKHITR